MNFENKLNIVISEIMSVYNLSKDQAFLIRQNIINRVNMYQNAHPNFDNNEAKIVANSLDIGDFFINRLVSNIRNYDFDQTYNPENTLKGAYISKNQSIYIGNYKFIEDITLNKLQNRIANVDSETLRKATLNVFNHEVGHALQTSFNGRYGINDNKYIQLISNLTSKFPNVFKLQATEKELTIEQEGMKVIRHNEQNTEAREFYAKNAFTIYLDEIFNEDEALKVTGVNQPQLIYNIGNGFSKSIYNYQSSNYRITSYGRMMKIVMGEDLTFKSMYEDSILAYEFFDQFKDVSDKIYKGKPPMYNILNSLNKIKNENSLTESLKLDLFLTVCLQRKVSHDLKNPNLTQEDINNIKKYISEFNNQILKNPNLITQQEKIISNINNKVIECEKQLAIINQNSNVKNSQKSTDTISAEGQSKDNYQKINLEMEVNKDYNYYFNEMLKLMQRCNSNNKMSEEEMKNLMDEIFYCEGCLIESLTNDEEIKQIITRLVNEVGNNEMQIRVQNIILTDIQEKYKQLHINEEDKNIIRK